MQVVEYQCLRMFLLRIGLEVPTTSDEVQGKCSCSLLILDMSMQEQSEKGERNKETSV